MGTVSSKTLILKAGKPEELAEFPPSMESQFRQLGLQIKLEGGRFYLLSDYVVCKEGQNLTPDQSKMIVRRKINFYLKNFIFIFSPCRDTWEYKWMSLKYTFMHI